MGALFVPVDEQSNLVDAHNRLIWRDSGASGWGQRVVWTDYDGVEKDRHTGSTSSSNNHTLKIRNSSGYHVLVRNAGDSADLFKVEDARVTVGTGLTVSTGGASITGGLTVPSGGVTVTAGGLTVSAGGASVTGGVTAATGNVTASNGDHVVSTSGTGLMGHQARRIVNSNGNDTHLDSAGSGGKVVVTPNLDVGGRLSVTGLFGCNGAAPSSRPAYLGATSTWTKTRTLADRTSASQSSYTSSPGVLGDAATRNDLNDLRGEYNALFNDVSMLGGVLENLLQDFEDIGLISFD